MSWTMTTTATTTKTRAMKRFKNVIGLLSLLIVFFVLNIGEKCKADAFASDYLVMFAFISDMRIKIYETDKIRYEIFV